LKYWLDNYKEPEEEPIPDTSELQRVEEMLGDDGVVCIFIASALCQVAPYFNMEDFLIIAMTEPELFHEAIRRVQTRFIMEVEAFSAAAPNRIWCLCGPEYVTEPYLSPKFFNEYVVPYDTPVVDAIKKHGGFIRLHCHGKIKNNINNILCMGYHGLDPIEPPPQGDITLADVRRSIGKKMFLLGDIEMNEVELMDEEPFTERVKQSLRDGTAGEGCGFILSTSSFPINRVVTPKILRNHEIMVEQIEKF